MRGKRCPRCGQLSFSARTAPPWPCPFCGAECFYAPDEPLRADEEALQRETDTSEAVEGLNASPLAGRLS